jgi:hypothetical protein
LPNVIGSGRTLLTSVFTDVSFVATVVLVLPTLEPVTSRLIAVTPSGIRRYFVVAPAIGVWFSPYHW